MTKHIAECGMDILKDIIDEYIENEEPLSAFDVSIYFNDITHERIVEVKDYRNDNKTTRYTVEEDV